jgi:hypothetical protein
MAWPTVLYFVSFTVVYTIFRCSGYNIHRLKGLGGLVEREVTVRSELVVYWDSTDANNCNLSFLTEVKKT